MRTETVGGWFLVAPGGAGPRTFPPEAAADSWERVLAFFDTHLRRGTPRP